MLSDSPSPKQAVLTGIVLYLLCQIFFLIYIQFPVKVNFDEFHYVPTALDFLQGKSERNWEHPPLGKLLIAAGIHIGGNRPFGWRLASSWAGALTIAGLYFMALALFRSHRAALAVAGLSVVNFFVYVQSRIALLDTFMTLFLVWSLAALFAVLRRDTLDRRARQGLLASAVLAGLALGSKWPAAPIVPLSALFLWLKFRKAALPWLAVTLFVPLAVYALTLTPLLSMQGFRYRWYEFFRLHSDVLRGLSAKNEPHFYESNWYRWPLMLRSIWYAFDREGPQHQWVRGVFLIGNPILMWSGLVAIGACAWAAFKDRAREPLWIVSLFLGLWLFWVFLPRRVSFLYYYYPSALMLGPAIVFTLRRFPSLRPAFGIFAAGLAVRALIPPRIGFGYPVYLTWGGLSLLAAYGLEHLRQRGKLRPVLARQISHGSLWVFGASATFLFIWFFPILSALRITTDDFRRWMWFLHWI